MANKRFKDYGQIPNYPVTSNDASHLVPPEGYGHDNGRWCYSYFMCGNNSQKTYGDMTWHKKWSLPFVHDVSECGSGMDRFGRGKNHVQNDVTNSRSGDKNPSYHHLFWNGTVPQEDKCVLMSKPMGTTYKAFVGYWGDPLSIDSESNVWYLGSAETDKKERILPMGLSFSFQNWHEQESGLLNAYSRVQMQALMMVIRDYNGRFSLAELFGCNDNDYMTQSSNSANQLAIYDSKIRIPGKWKKYSGSKNHIHNVSEPGGGGSLSRSAPPPTNSRAARSGLVLGTYGHVYYEFSKKTQDYIVENKCYPVGLMMKWGGGGSGGVYNAASWWCYMYDMLIISQQGFSPIDSNIRFDRICNPVRGTPSKKSWTQHQTIDGKKFMEFPLVD